MATIYTPSANSVANILNRRSNTIYAETITKLKDFDHLLRTQEEMGDTLEFITSALAPREDYDATIDQATKFTETVLNKYYEKININKVYYASTPFDEYQKALANPKAVAELSAKVVENISKSWAVDLYNNILHNAMMNYGVDGFTNIAYNAMTDITDDTMPTLTQVKIGDENGTKEEYVDQALNIILGHIEKMRFYGQDYIDIDSTLTEAQASRILANADYSDLTLYIHYEYYNAVQSELSKRFRNLVDLDQKIKIVKVNLSNQDMFADFSAMILHNNCVNFYPRTIQAQETTPLGALRTDHALIVQGTITVNTLYPHIYLGNTEY